MVSVSQPLVHSSRTRIVRTGDPLIPVGMEQIGHPNVGATVVPGKVSRQNSDHLVAFAIQHDDPADDSFVTGKATAPQFMTQNGNVTVAPVGFFPRKAAPKHGLYTDHLKKSRR